MNPNKITQNVFLSSQHVLDLVKNQKPKRNRHETSNRRSNTNNCYNSTNSRNSQPNRRQTIPPSQARNWDNQQSMYRQQHGSNEFVRQNSGNQQQFANQTRPFEPGNLLAPPNTLAPNRQMMNQFYNIHNNNGILGHIPSLFSIQMPNFSHFTMTENANKPKPRCVSNQHSRNSNRHRSESNKKPTPSTSSSADIEQSDSNEKMNGNAVSPSSKKMNGHAVSLSNEKMNGHANMPDVSCSDSSEHEVDALPSIDDVS